MNTWLVILSDLFALILTFFVMMYSLSDINTKYWEHFVSNKHIIEESKPNNEHALEKSKPSNKGFNSSYISSIFRNKLPSEFSELYIREHDEQVIIEIPHHIFQKNGILHMDDYGKQILHLIGGIIEQFPNQLEIIGYACRDTLQKSWHDALQISTFLGYNIYKYHYTTEYIHMKGKAMSANDCDTGNKIEIVLTSQQDIQDV